MAALNHPSAYPPSATALLVCDLQNMIMGMVDDSVKPKIISSTKTLLDTARAKGVHIFHCLIDTELDPLPTSKVADRWATMYKPMLTANQTLGLEYAEVAAPAGGEREITVTRRPGRTSALRSEGLTPALLREKYGVKSLVVCGIATGGVVLSTAKQAADDDFVVTVVEDACCDRDPNVHKMLMERAFESGAWVMGLQEAVGVLEGK